MPKKKPRKRNADVYIAIGLRIKQFRTSKKMSQDELASKASLKRPSVVLIENGKQRLPVDRLCYIAKALDVEPAHLMPRLKEIFIEQPGDYPVFLHGAENFEANEVNAIREHLKNAKKKQN